MARRLTPPAPLCRSPVALAALGAALALAVWLATPAPAAGDGRGGIGFSGKPGDRLPREVELRDDTGAMLRFGDLADRPLLLTFVPFSCGRQCPLVLGGLAETLGRLRLRPGVDYRIVTISIDENDTPERAAAAKRNYVAAAGAGFPPSAWAFLTGDRVALGRLATAAGLSFERHGGHFFHPEVLLAVAPGGVIAGVLPVAASRFNGPLRVTFPTTELEEALAAARRGTLQPGRPPEPLYCLPYEREPERAFHRLLRIFGLANLLVLGAFLLWLFGGTRRGAAGG